MPETMSARAIMERLVSFPTVSSASNLDLVDWVEGYLGTHGVLCRRVWNEDRTKAALFANVGPMVEGGIVLSGHTDVVPVEGQNWTSDPFTVTERNGRLYGRGTADMKGFDAIALAAVPLALERKVKRPLQIALSYDEEIGCTGAPPMIDRMVAEFPRAGAAVIGEPSMLRAVTGHKASSGFRVHFRGFEVHSSMMHQGVSAIMEAARLIDWANRMNAQNAAREPDAADADFLPPWTTIHVGEISGGTAHNITAGDCRLQIEFRVVPGEDIAQWHDRFFEQVQCIEASMEATRPEAGIRVEKTFQVPGLKPENDGRAEAIVRSLTGDNGTHVVSYGTEAGQFQERGYSAVICGPGDIAQAHQADEYITVAQFEAGEALVARLVDTLCD